MFGLWKEFGNILKQFAKKQIENEFNKDLVVLSRGTIDGVTLYCLFKKSSSLKPHLKRSEP